jgi:hypothetical protein
VVTVDTYDSDAVVVGAGVYAEESDGWVGETPETELDVEYSEPEVGSADEVGYSVEVGTGSTSEVG